MQLTINISGKLMDFTSPKVMGIVNATSDSFYGGSRVGNSAAIASKLADIIGQGADIVDIGGYSTRPGASDIAVDVEVERVCGVLDILRREYGDFPISVDTFRGEVVRRVYDKFGAFVVNDVSGGTLDEEIIKTVGELKLPYILGHIKGTPQTMDSMNNYDDMMQDILKYFVERLELARRSGVVDLILDPCFGFAKNIEQNFSLLKSLDYFNVLGLPILAGLSRKSMIFKTLGVSPDEALNGTTALNFVALEKGAKILRVHDVKEAVEVVKLYNCYAKAK